MEIFFYSIFTNIHFIYFQLVSTSEGNQKNRDLLNRRTNTCHLQSGIHLLAPALHLPTARVHRQAQPTSQAQLTNQANHHTNLASLHTSLSLPTSLNSHSNRVISLACPLNLLINHHSLPILLVHQLLVTNRANHQIRHLHHLTNRLHHPKLQVILLLPVTSLLLQAINRPSHRNLVTITQNLVTNPASPNKLPNRFTCHKQLVVV